MHTLVTKAGILRYKPLSLDFDAGVESAISCKNDWSIYTAQAAKHKYSGRLISVFIYR